MFWGKKKKVDNELSVEPAGMFRFEALYLPEEVINLDSLFADLAQRIGEFDFTAQTPEMTGIAVKEYTADWGEGKELPVQILFLMAEDNFELEKHQDDIVQTWDWPEKAEVLSRCRKRLVVTDFMARGLGNSVRVRLFNAIISAVIEVTKPLAIYTPQSGCFRNPATFLEYKENGGLNYGFFNIRFFRIENSGSDAIMDSIGLSVFSLPDVQCHFHDLDTAELAANLYNVANYILGAGDVIEDGHTVQGLDPSQKWKCQHEEAMLGPKRVVLDIDPGTDFAAGNRKRAF